MEVRALALDDLEPLAHLFDQYRVFYRKPPDPAAARDFIRHRLEREDSALLGAYLGTQLVGFTQLYPCFTSVGMQRIWILNDLYVHEDARRKGVASALMDAAREYAELTGATRLELATERTNTGAQKLYENLGWQRDHDFYHYSFTVES